LIIHEVPTSLGFQILFYKIKQVDVLACIPP